MNCCFLLVGMVLLFGLVPLQVHSGVVKYTCLDTMNRVLAIDPIENGKRKYTVFNGGQFADLPGPGINNATMEMHLNMTCTWIIEADPNHEVHIYLAKHDLHKLSDGSCTTHNESTEIINEEKGTSTIYCGYLSWEEKYIVVPADKVTIKLKIGDATFSRKHDIIVWQEAAGVKKRSADDVDPTVGSKRRLPKKLTESEIIETAKFFAFGNNRRTLCTDCDRRPFVEDYCICQDFLQDPCEIKPTDAPTQQSEEDTLVEEESSRRRRRQISQLKSSRRA